MVYINPTTSDSDVKRNVHMASATFIEKKIEDVSRDELTKKNQSALFVLSHSAYYVGTSIINLVRPGDEILIIQHVLTNRTTYADAPLLADACSHL